MENNLPANASIMTICGTVIIGLILRYVIRFPNYQLQKPELDTYQIAYLAGGTTRVVELAIIEMVYWGYLRADVVNKILIVKKQLPPEASLLQQQIMRQVEYTSSLKYLRQYSKYETTFLRKSLEKEKLLMTGCSAFIGKSYLFIVPITIIVGILITIVNHLVQIQILGMNLVEIFDQLIFILTLCCAVPSLRTRWGDRMLANIEQTHDSYDVIQRFALFGYKTLSGGVFDDLKQIFKVEAEAEEAASGCGC